MDRASDSGSEGWGFESLPACQVGASVIPLVPAFLARACSHRWFFFSKHDQRSGAGERRLGIKSRPVFCGSPVLNIVAVNFSIASPARQSHGHSARR